MSDDRRQTMGSTRYQWDEAIYCGDGANTTVILPEGKTVESVNPPYPFRIRPHQPDVLEFDRAIPSSYLVTITLRDAE